MKLFFLIYLCLYSIQNTFSQYFEGVLTYKIQMNDSDSYTTKIFIKNNDIVNLTKVSDNDSEYVLTSFYSNEFNKSYSFSENDTLQEKDMSDKFFPSEIKRPEIIINDSIVNVFGEDLESILIVWDKIYAIQYFYNKDLVSIDSTKFKNYEQDAFNIFTKETGAYPLIKIQHLPFLGTMKQTITNIENVELNEKRFVIPKTIQQQNKLRKYLLSFN